MESSKSKLNLLINISFLFLVILYVTSSIILNSKSCSIGVIIDRYILSFENIFIDEPVLFWIIFVTTDFFWTSSKSLSVTFKSSWVSNCEQTAFIVDVAITNPLSNSYA